MTRKPKQEWAVKGELKELMVLQSLHSKLVAHQAQLSIKEQKIKQIQGEAGRSAADDEHKSNLSLPSLRFLRS